MNKNFKKSMALALTLIIGIFSLFNQSFADTSYLDSSGLESVDNIFNDEINSNGIFGEDEYVYISENFNNSDIKPRATSFYTRESIVNTQRKNWVFCGYAVPTWQKASSYQSGKTYSASTGYNFYGISTTIGVSRYANATIPADAKRMSRLGAYADITFKKIKIDYYQGGYPKPYKTTYRVDKIYHNKYLSVVYK